MPVLRPVSTEARLTLVEHLGELRTRLFVSIGILIVAFAFTYWQNSRVLDVINRPLDKAQTSTPNCDKKVDPITAGDCFDRSVAKALGQLGPVVTSLSRSSDPADVRQALAAAVALQRAKDLAPKGEKRKPVTLGVAEPFFQTINVALYAALVITLPLLLYQLYAFLIPAFTRRERQAIVPLLLGVPFLFYAGVAFGYFLALPRAVDFLQNFNADNFDILVQAKDYYKFVLLFLAGTGVVFQVPVLVIGLSRMGIFTPKQMRKQRGLVALASAVVAAIITPTPDAVTMLLMMVPLIVLFEVSVLIAAILDRRTASRERRASRWDADDDDGGGDDADPGAGPDDPLPPLAGGDADAMPPVAREDPVVADDDGDRVGHPARPPSGEDPDPELLGDPAGPQVVGPVEAPDDRDLAPEPTGDPLPDPDPDDWHARADEADADDPYAEAPTADPGPDDPEELGNHKE